MAKRRLPGGSRPSFTPTPAQRAQVTLLAGFGLTREQIALMVTDVDGTPIAQSLVDVVFDKELKVGAAMVNAKVVESLYRKAIGNGTQSVTAAIWWTKARMGWRSTERIEHAVEGNHGVLVVPGRVTPQEWLEAQDAKNATRKPRGGTKK